MDTQLQSGQQVTVYAFGGKKLSRVVVEDRGNVVLICKPEEFELARAQGRPAVSVGFRRVDVATKL